MKHCNIVPQVFNSTVFVDSELFKSILQTGVSRPVAKRVFEAYNSNEFKAIFGDWKLYQALKFNKTTPIQMATFQSLYNGDMKLLESTIDLSNLNNLYEPIIGLPNRDLTEGRVKEFESEKTFDLLAKSINIDNVELKKYITSKGHTLNFRFENTTITPVKGGNSFSSLSTFNSESLTQDFDNAEVIYLSNLTSSIIIDNINEFDKLLKDKKNKNLTTEFQVEAIDKFIINKIKSFKSKLLANIDSKIESLSSKDNSPSELSMIETLKFRKFILEDNYNKFIEEFTRVSDNGKRSFLYRSFKSYLGSEFGIFIANKDTTVLVSDLDENGSYIEVEENPAEFMTQGALRTNKMNNVQRDLKLLISKSIIKDTFKSVDGNVNLSNKYGIEDILKIDDVWSTLISITMETNGNFDKLIMALKSVNVSNFNKRLTHFIETLETDVNIQNSFYSSINLSVIPNNSMNIQTNFQGNTTITTKPLNYNSFAGNVAYEDILRNIQLKLESDATYGSSLVSDFESAKDKKIIKHDAALVEVFSKGNPELWIIQQFRKLGIDSKITNNDLQIYIFNSLGISLDELGNYSKKINTLQYHAGYTSLIREIVSSLIYTSVSLNDVSKEYHDLKSKKKKNKLKQFKFRNKFTNKSALRTISNIVIHNYYGKTNQSYLNVNGDTEYSPQYHSYLTTFLDAITPIKGKIDLDNAKEKLKDFINDPLLANNKFLYNLEGVGFGLFNVQFEGGYPAKNENGLPIIKSINPDFETYFNKEGFGGISNKDISQGMKYDEIKGDTWNIVSIIASLTGTYIIPSSDSPRSFSITLAKYGLKNFMFDEAGNYLPLTDIRNKIGSIIKGYVKEDGTVVPDRYRTAEDITEDSLFYFEEINNTTKEIQGFTKSYKEISDSSTISKELEKDIYNVFKFLRIHILNSNEDISKLKYFNNPLIKKIRDNEGIQGNIEEGIFALKLLLKEITGVKDSELNSSTFVSDVLKDRNDLFQYKDADLIKIPIVKYKNIFERNYKFYLNIEAFKDVNVILEQDKKLEDRINEFRNSTTGKHIVDIVIDELNVIRKIANQLFTFEYRYVNNKSLVKSINTTKWANENIGSLHGVTDYDGNSILSKNKDGKLEPTGKGLYFHRMSYLEKGKKVTLNDYIKSQIGSKLASQADVIDLILRSKIETHPLKDRLSPEDLEADFIQQSRLLNELIYEFIDKVLEYNQQVIIKDSRDFKEELMQKYVTIPPYVHGTHPRYDYKIGEKYSTRLIDTNTKIDSSDVEYVDEEGNVVEDSEKKTQIKSERLEVGYTKSMLEVFVNDYIYNSQIGEDLLYGRPYEYKGALDVNKRGSQVFKNGKSSISNETFSSVVFGDIVSLTNMLDKLSTSDNLDKKVIYQRYLKTANNKAREAEVGNGLSFITVKEFIKRLKVSNMWDGRLKEYVEDLTDETKPFNPNKYDYVAEQLKYFLYARQASNHGTLQGSVQSYQEKNSTIVLFPKLYKGTEFGVIAEWMEANNVDSGNFLSGAKVGGQPVFELHDTFRENIDTVKNAGVGYILKKAIVGDKVVLDDRIDRNQPFSDTNKIDIEKYKTYHKLSNLRVQQETVGHLVDETGILSTQLIKVIVTNLFEGQTYTIGEGNNILEFSSKGDKENPGFLEMFNYALSYNAKHSRDMLLAAWGGIKDGKVNYRPDGTIEIDVNKIRESIQEYAFRSGDINLMRAFEASQDNKTEPLLDFNFPTINKSIENLTNATITKRITRQTLKQIHGTITPDVFLSPAMAFRNSNIDSMDSDIMQDYIDNGWISLTTKFMLECEKKGKLELDSEYNGLDDEGNPVFNHAQVILNLWDTKLNKYRKTKTRIVNGEEVIEYYIDIDSIPSETLRMVATRIPNEGLQSAMTIEVVGIMNTSASQIIVPQQLALQTGWDYDIDSLYVYPRHLYERTDFVNGITGTNIYPISLQYDKNNRSSAYDTDYNQRLNYFKTYYSNNYNVIENTKKIDIAKARDSYKKAQAELIASSRKSSISVINEINNAIKQKDSGELSSEAFTILLRKVLSLSDNTSTPSIEALRRFENNVKDAVAIRDTYQAYTEMLDSAISDILQSSKVKITKKGLLIDETKYQELNKQFEYNFDFKAESLKLKEQLNKTISEIQEVYEEALEQEVYYNSEFNKKFESLPELERVSREVRDNLIVDLIEAKLKHPDSNIHRTKPNEFENSRDIHDYVNKVTGMSTSNLNYSQLPDRNIIRKGNNDSRTLKGISVSLDNLYRVTGTIGAQLGNSKAIPIKMSFDEFITYDATEQVKALDEVFGFGNYVIVDDGYIVFSTNLGNNKSGTGKNVAGAFISEQASEITAHVLDVVKFKFHNNIDNNTLPIVSLLAYSGISHQTDVTGNSRNSSLAYSNILLAQPIIGAFLDKLAYNSRNGEYADKNRAIRNITNDIYSQVLSLASKVDIITGKVTEDSKNTILDVALNNLKLSDKFNSVLLFKTINEWKNNVYNGKSITLYNNSAIDVYALFNEILTLISIEKNKDKSKEIDYLKDSIIRHLETKYDSIKSKEIYDSIENSKQIKLIRTISELPKIGGRLFNYSTKDGYTNVDSNSIKSITELNKILKDAIDEDYTSMSDAYSRVSNEDNLDSSSSYITYLKNQLQVLKHFEYLNESYNLISKAQLVLKTEKLETSASISDKLFRDIAELHIDSKEFERRLIATEEFTLAQIDNFRLQYSLAKTIYPTTRIIEKAKKDGSIEYEEVSNNDGKINVIKEFIKNSNGKLTVERDIPYTQINVGKQQLVEAVFPNYLTNKINQDFDFRDSKYSYFEAQLVYSQVFGTQVFSDIFVFQKPEFKALLSSVLSEFNLDSVGQIKKDYITNAVKSIIVNHKILNHTPFFNGAYGNRTSEEEILRVIGEVDFEEVEGSTKSKTKLNKGKVTIDYIPNINDYSELSVANQVHILQNNIYDLYINSKSYNVKSISDYFEIKEFLDMIEVSISEEDLNNNGYHRMSVKDNGKSALKLQQVFNKLYFNDNAYIRQTARDLIRYAFYTSGLAFGHNIAKYVDLSLYYNDFNVYEKLNEDFENRLSRTNDVIKGLRYDSNMEFTNEYKDTIVDIVTRQLFEDNSINPMITKQKPSPNQPSFSEALEIDGIKQPIIKELASKIKDSRYSKYKSIKAMLPSTVKKKELGIDDSKGLLFRKIEFKDDAYVYYYPITKSLKFELGVSSEGTIVNKYKQGIQSPQYYKTLIETYSNANKTVNEQTHNSELLYVEEPIVINGEYKQNVNTDYNYAVNITNSDKSYTETAKELINNSDVILYIGKDKFYKEAFKSEKTVYTTIEDFNINILDEIDFNSPVKLTIVGDTISNNNISQQQYDNIIMPYVTMLARLANLKNIRTIYKTGVGESIFKSTFNKNLPTEFIKVGTKDTISEITFNSENLSNEFDVNSVEFDLSDLISNTTSNIVMLSRLHNHYKNITEIPSNDLNMNLFEIRDMLKDMNDRNERFEAIPSAIKTISSKIDKIVQIIMYDTININDTNVHTILDIPIFKYISSTDTRAKVLISKKLMDYANLIKVAKILVDMKPLDTLNLTDEQVSNLSVTDKETYNNLKDGIDKINDEINKLKHTKLQGEDGNIKVFSKDEDRKFVVDTLSNKVNLAIAQYFVTMVWSSTRNPKFSNSKFNKVLDNIKNEVSEEVSISSAELSELYKDLLIYNNDITSTQFYLDSMWDTGVAMVDNTRNILTEIRLDNNLQQYNKLEELKDIVEKHKTLRNLKVNDRTVFNHSTHRETMFKKLVNPETGKFYDLYNWEELYRNLNRDKVVNNKYKDLKDFLNKSKTERTFKYDFYFTGVGIEKYDTSVTKENTISSIQNQLFYLKNLFIDTEISEDNKKLLEEFKNKAFVSLENGVTTYKLSELYFGETKIEVLVKFIGNEPIDNVWRKSTFFKVKDETLSISDIENSKDSNDYFSKGSEPGKYGRLEEIEVFQEIEVSTINEDGSVTIETKKVFTPEFKYYWEVFENHRLDLNEEELRRFENKHHIKIEVAYKETVEKSKNRAKRKSEAIKNNEKYFMDDRELGVKLNIYKIIPNDEYINSEYSKISEEQLEMLADVKQYLQDIVGAVFPSKFLDDNFIPYLFITHQLGWKDSFKRFINWQNIQKENTTIDIFGERPVHYFKSHSLTMPSVRNLIRIESKNPNESMFEYEDRVIKEANDKLKKLKVKHPEFKDVPEFTSKVEVDDFNQEVVLEYIRNTKDNLNYDMINVLHDLTLELYNIKSQQEFSYTYQLLTNIMSQDTFEARAENLSGKNIVDSAIKKIKGTYENVSKKGTNTEVYKRVLKGENVIYDVSKVNTKFDQIVGSALKYTSMNVMWFNYHTGVKNVMKGVSDLFIEYYGGEYANRKEFGKGFNRYMNNVSDIFSSSLTGIFKTKEAALIHKFKLIYNDHSERFSDKDTGGIGSKLNSWAERGGYFFMTGGEHFLQFTTMFTLLESHRLVDGFAMNINEFNTSRHLEIAKSILSESNFKLLDKFVKDNSIESKGTDIKYRHRNLVNEWLRYNIDIVGSEGVVEFNKQIEENKQTVIEKFKEYPTLESMYSFKDNKLEIDERFTKDIEADFIKRVEALNQSMHGIYNTLDRSVIQNTLSGEVIFQFRKWMRPTWVRYMGDRYSPFSNADKSTFNERLGKKRSGAFADFGRFMRTAYIINKYKKGKDPELNAFVNMFNEYANFLKNYTYYYNLLTPTQQANVKRTYAFIATLIGLTLLVTVAGIGYGDDDDNMPKYRDWLLYNLSGLQTEYMEVLPYYGWFVFYKRTKENIVPVERQMNNLVKLLYDSAAYPFRTNEQREYQRGQYAGQSKISVDLMKAIPVVRQINKELYLSNSINYYGMYNSWTSLGR